MNTKFIVDGSEVTGTSNDARNVTCEVSGTIKTVQQEITDLEGKSGAVPEDGQIYYEGNTVPDGYVLVSGATKSPAQMSSAIDTINDNLTASNPTAGVTNVPFRFGCTDDGKFGYIINQGGADSVIPFSNGLVNACIAFSGYDAGGMGSILIDEDGESTFASGTQSDQNDAFNVVYSGSGGYFRYIYAKKVGKVRVINSSNKTDTIINVTTANQLIGTLQGDHWSPNPKYGAIMAIYV